MPDGKFDDRTEEMVNNFKDAMARWSDPVGHPTIRWRDVEDARLDVIQHRSELARRKMLPGQPQQS